MNITSNDNYRHHFLKVVDELRAALGYALRTEDPEPGEDLAMEMMYGGFDFAVVHSLAKRPDSLLIECIFGPVPDGRGESIMRRLLEMNAALAELDGSTFCLDPSGEQLVYTLAIDLTHLDGSVLLRKMTEIVWHGRRWLETRYMNQDESGKGELLNPVQLA
jgi:hypothetical protein